MGFNANLEYIYLNLTPTRNRNDDTISTQKRFPIGVKKVPILFAVVYLSQYSNTYLKRKSNEKKFIIIGK